MSCIDWLTGNQTCTQPDTTADAHTLNNDVPLTDVEPMESTCSPREKDKGESPELSISLN